MQLRFRKRNLPQVFGVLVALMRFDQVNRLTVSFLLLPFASGYGLDGAQLRMAAIHIPPFDMMTRTSDGNYSVEGSSLRVYQWLSKKLNFTFDVIPVVDEALIAKLGSIEAGLSKVKNKEVDGILSGFTITHERSQQMDFTFLIWVDYYTLIVPSRGEESRLFAFVFPFGPAVWFSLAASLTAIVLLMTSFAWCYREAPGFKSHLIHSGQRNSSVKSISMIPFYTVFTVSLISNHGTYIPNRQHSFRILTGCWLLAATVLVHSYSSTVTSHLTLPKMKLAVNSFEDLTLDEDIGLIVREDHVLGQEILNASSGTLKILGDQLRHHPDRKLSDASSVLIKLQTGRYAYPYVRTFCRYFVAEQYQRHGECRFQVSDILSPTSVGYFSMLLQKGHEHTAAISFAMLQLWETGLIGRWVAELIPKADKCFASYRQRKESLRQAKVKLEDLTSAFFILGCGVSLASLCFMVEMIIFMCQKRRARTRRAWHNRAD